MEKVQAACYGGRSRAEHATSHPSKGLFGIRVRHGSSSVGSGWRSSLRSTHTFEPEAKLLSLAGGLVMLQLDFWCMHVPGRCKSKYKVSF